MTDNNQFASPPLVVAHSMPFWLPLTSPWLFNQIRFLPEEINNLVICEWTDNLDQFSIHNIHSLMVNSRLLRKGYRVLRQVSRLPYAMYLERVAKGHKARVVHSHWGDAAWRNLKAVRKIGAKHVVTFYGKDVNHLPHLNPIWLVRYAELFKEVDAVLCEGPHMAACIEKMGCPADKIHVHHLGVEVEKIKYSPRRWSPDVPLKILIAASFREKKGIPYALEAIGTLTRSLRAIEVTVIGDVGRDVRSQTEKSRIMQVIRMNGLEGKVRLLGYQPYERLMEESYNHHIFISPSVTADDGDTEGGAPVTLIDMAASGMPIVSSYHCDIPNVILHGKTGLLAPERDAGKLAEHLQWLVERPDAWPAMLEAGREHVSLHFDARAQAIRLGNLYRALVIDEKRF